MSELGGIDAGRLSVRVVSDVGDLDKDLERKVNSAVAGATKAADRGSRDIGKSMRGVGAKASLFLTAPILAVGAAVTKAASDTIEQVNKTNVVFGEFAGSVIAFADTSAKNIGISKRSALEAAGTFGNLFRAMGVTADTAAKTSTSMVTLAGDLASFNNASPEEVLDALRSGLIGEAEPLRKFGIQLSETRVAAEAAALGIVKPVRSLAELTSANIKVEAAQKAAMEADKKYGIQSIQSKQAHDALRKALDAQKAAVIGNIPPLTDAQKLQARQSIILKDSALAQGDFSRSLDTSLANQQRVSKALADDAKAAIGENLIPLVQKGTIFLGKLAGAFSNMSPKAQKATLIIGGSVAALGPLLTVGGNVIRLYKGMGKAVEFFRKEQTIATVKMLAHKAVLIAQAVATKAVALATKAWTLIQAAFNLVMSANPIVLVAIAIAALVAGIIIAYRESETFRRIVQAVFSAIANAVKVAVDFIVGAVMGYVNLVRGVATAVLHAYVAVWSAILGTIVGIAKALWAGIVAVFNVGKAVVLGYVNALKAGVMLAFDGLRAIVGVVTKVWDGIKRAFQIGRDAVVTVVRSLVSGVKAVMGGIGSAFDGLKDAVRSAINFVIRGWNRLEFKIPGFDPPGPGPKFGGFTLGVPDIPELEAGALIRHSRGGTVVRVGEGRHDEIVGPLDTDMRNRLGMGSGGITVEAGGIVVNNPVAEPASQSVNTRLRRLAVLGPPVLTGGR